MYSLPLPESCLRHSQAEAGPEPRQYLYDVRRTWITRIGFLEEKKVQVTKGERVFPHPVARTDAEIWLEMKKAHFNPLWSSSVIDSRT